MAQTPIKDYCGFSMNPQDYSGFYLVHYTMPSGRKKSVLEREDMIPSRLTKLAWANIIVTDIVKQKET